MKCVIIDKELFTIDRPESEGLISALIKIRDAGNFVCCYNLKEINASFLDIIRNEGIELYEYEKLDCELSVVISTSQNDSNNSIYVNSVSGYKNILDAASNIFSPNRTAIHQRSTKETNIEIELNLDGEGKSDIATGIGFFDHMLEQISRHGNIDLKIKVNGDLHVDEHHTVEDVGIALGETILIALDDKAGIKRYGFMLPMDDTIARVAIDLGGRQYLNYKCKLNREFVGEFPTELTEEFFKGLAQGMKANIYIRAKGKNDHHKIEAIFKAFAKSLNEACRYDERAKGKLPSTKGVI